jgi:hypothetical protein
MMSSRPATQGLNQGSIYWSKIHPPSSTSPKLIFFSPPEIGNTIVTPQEFFLTFHLVPYNRGGTDRGGTDPGEGDMKKEKRNWGMKMWKKKKKEKKKGKSMFKG